MHFPKHSFSICFFNDLSLLCSLSDVFTIRRDHYIPIGSFTHFVRMAPRQLKRIAALHCVQLRLPSSAAVTLVTLAKRVGVLALPAWLTY